ncbi:MAG TPA: FliH/SctL family protein [Tepidisphaeraceae bacterium]|jgi:flagellar assembly protein FliH|nr:FliH/SctL family protein [Tepidisphaeraceae bacterium]
MGLIKATQAPPTLQAFSMKDIETQARAIILRAQQHAEQLLAEAQSEAETLKARAMAEGFAEGRNNGIQKGNEEGKKLGLQQALSEHRAQLANVIKAITSATQELNTSRQQLDATAKSEIIHLAVAIARRATKRQGTLDPNVLTDNVHEAMKLVSQTTDIRIAIHPREKQTLLDALPKLSMTWPKLQHVQLIEDPTLTAGGCRILTAGGEIDADLDRQIDRIASDLVPSHREDEAPAEPLAVSQINKGSDGASPSQNGSKA